MPVTVLIIGANFDNKGAQSMLFTTICAIRKKFTDARIIFGHPDECDITPYKMEEVYFSSISVQHVLGEDISKFLWKIHLKNMVRPLIGRRKVSLSAAKCKELKKILPEVDFIVDISGFALGCKWGSQAAVNYITNIRMAKKYNIPIVLMPQSFGPFNFEKNQEKIDAMLQEYMPYPIRIFAREKDGEIPLREKYALENVTHHADLVLCSSSPDLSLIYHNVPEINVPQVNSVHSVGVLPNMRSFDRGGNKEQILEIFRHAIERLLEKGKTVYVFRHSVEDIVPCRWIKEMFSDDERVILWENDFSCFEYDMVCRQFEFLLVGRFHGIVHAYRNNIPCILLGWVVKYKELAKLMGQENFVFDITAKETKPEIIAGAVEHMDENLSVNKEIIRRNLAKVQANQECFEVMLKGIEDAANMRMDS